LHPLTRIGSTLASTKAGVANLLAEKYQEIVNPSAVGKDKDILNQLADDLAEWSEEDFILPMRDEKYGGYGSLELLLNGFSGLQAWDGLYDWDAAEKLQIVVAVNAPYYVHNKSSILAKITPYYWWRTNDGLSDLKSLSIYDYSKKSEDRQLVAKKLNQVDSISKNPSDGDYFISSEQRVYVVRSVYSDAIAEIGEEMANARLMVWLRISLDGDESSDNYVDKDNLWFPFRRNSYFQDKDVQKSPVTWITAESVLGGS